MLSFLNQCIIFLPCTGQLVREYRKVIAYCHEEHLRSHRKRWHFTGHLLDTVMQAVELLLGLRKFRGHYTRILRHVLKLFQLGLQFLNLFLQCLNPGNIPALVQIGRCILPDKTQLLQLVLKQGNEITKIHRLLLRLRKFGIGCRSFASNIVNTLGCFVQSGGQTVFHQEFYFYWFTHCFKFDWKNDIIFLASSTASVSVSSSSLTLIYRGASDSIMIRV